MPFDKTVSLSTSLWILGFAVLRAGQPTTTTLQALGSPLSNGQIMYTFTATVKSGNTPVTPGTVHVQ